MAVRMITDDEAGALAGIYSEIRSCLGLRAVPNVFRAMAAVNADVLIQNWTAYRHTFLDGELPRVLKEMVGLVVSRQNACDYSERFHAHVLELLGVPGEVIRNLVESGDSERVPAPHRPVLKFARAYFGAAADAPTEGLEAAGLTEEETQEVIDTVLLVESMNQFAAESDVPVDG